MKSVFCAITLLMAPLLAMAEPMQPTEIVPGLTIEFPEEPVVSTQDSNRVFAYQGAEEGKAYALVVIDFGAPEKADFTAENLDTTYEGVVEGAKKRSKVLSDEIIEVAGLKALRLVTQHPQGQVGESIYLVSNGRLFAFQFISAGSDAALDQPKKQFFDSIRLAGSAAVVAGPDSEGDDIDPREFGKDAGRGAVIVLVCGVAANLVWRRRRTKAKERA